jgi:hypothetical protein
MKKSYIYSSAILAASLLMTGCGEDIYSPTLSPTDSDVMAQGVSLDQDLIFGVWEGLVEVGDVNTNHFEQTYRIEFQSVDDSEAMLSHWYVDATNNTDKSIEGLEYTYSLDGSTVKLTPKTSAANSGASDIIGVYTGNNNMELYTVTNSVTKQICTLTRIGDPQPSIKSVNRTLPMPGEEVIFAGRNLQFVDQVYLPTIDGETEITDYTVTSTQLQFIMPDVETAPGYVRFHSDGAHVSAFSPAMFCTNCVFFKDFSTNGTSAPYTGTEFENTIDINRSLFDKVTVVSSDNLPEGHALTYAPNTINPEKMLCFFGDTPIEWDVDSSLDPSTGLLRFSFGDRLKYVIDNSNGMITASTKCKNAAVQMDVYVYSNGQPVWNTGFFNFRLDKDQSLSLTQSWFASTAMWSISEPADFTDGWHTFTIPLTDFAVTKNDTYGTVGNLMNYLLANKKQSIIKILNYQLDATHPAQKLDSFQFCIANMRLVPNEIPENSLDEE